MSDKVATPIVDKNGKQTTVHKKTDLRPDMSRLSPLTVLPAARSIENLHPSNLTFDEIVSEWDDFQKSKHRWSANEKTTRKAMTALFTFIENPDVDTKTVDIPPYGKPFNSLRSYLSGMHFAKEMLSDDERLMLWWAESLLTKIDAESESGFVY